ncbi:MAG TPA: hypothetical protein VFQ25_01100 [Ktedonobacterales bacterium]|nr:hypothetical protein [Ktedonobacterales bacterium]
MALVKQQTLLRTIRTVLAANLACHEDDLTKDGTLVTVAEFREGRMRFPMREQSLSMATMGQSVVISCSAGRIDWTKAHLGNLTRERLFSASTIAQIQRYEAR